MGDKEESHGGLPTEAVLLQNLKRVGMDPSCDVLLETDSGGFPLRFASESCRKTWLKLLQQFSTSQQAPVELAEHGSEIDSTPDGTGLVLGNGAWANAYRQ